MELLRKNWYVLALQGLLLALLGAAVILFQEFTLEQLIFYLGITLLSFGLVMLIWGWLTRRKGGNWFGLLLFGALQMIVGALIQYDAGTATGLFTATTGSFAILVGLIQVIMGFDRSKSRYLYLLMGLVSLLLGILILVDPFNTPRALPYLTGFYSFLLGAFLIYYGFKARRLQSGTPPAGTSQDLSGAPSPEKTADKGPGSSEKTAAPEQAPSRHSQS